MKLPEDVRETWRNIRDRIEAAPGGKDGKISSFLAPLDGMELDVLANDIFAIHNAVVRNGLD